MASSDILKSKLSEVEALLAYFKQAAEKDISKDTVPDGDNNETQNNDEIVPPIMTDTQDEVPREPFKALFYDKKEILSLKEAHDIFEKEKDVITEMPNKPSAGEVFLFKAKNESSLNDWRSNGHRWFQANGGRWAYNGLLLRKVSHCVTPESGRKGTNKFQMISWSHKDKPMLTLVQFVGDHTLSVDFPHGNAKKNHMPYYRSAPSLIRELEVGSEKPAKVYQKKVFEAAPDTSSQRFKVPRNLGQVRNARQNFKKMTEGIDAFNRLNRLALEFPDIRFLATVPDLILVSVNPEMLDQVKQILKLDYDKSRQKQLLSYDTQFNLGDFYVSNVTIRDTRFRNIRTGAIPIIPAFLIVHERKFGLHHEMAWQIMCNLVEEISTKKFVAVSDDEFTEKERICW